MVVTSGKGDKVSLFVGHLFKTWPLHLECRGATPACGVSPPLLPTLRILGQREERGVGGRCASKPSGSCARRDHPIPRSHPVASREATGQNGPRTFPNKGKGRGEGGALQSSHYETISGLELKNQSPSILPISSGKNSLLNIFKCDNVLKVFFGEDYQMFQQL